MLFSHRIIKKRQIYHWIIICQVKQFYLYQRGPYCVLRMLLSLASITPSIIQTLLSLHINYNPKKKTNFKETYINVNTIINCTSSRRRLFYLFISHKIFKLGWSYSNSNQEKTCVFQCHVTNEQSWNSILSQIILVYVH